MGNAIIYARYSPRPHESESIRGQVEDLQTWCRSHELQPTLVCFDPDVSGTVGAYERPGLATALRSLRKGDVLVIRNLNRAARSISVGLLIEEEVERVGARLAVLESGGMQPSKAEDRNAWCMRVIMYLMSDMQRMETNERTSRRMKQHQENGRSMGGHAPYGWRKDGSDLIPDSDEQSVIEHVKQLSKTGHTVGEIAVRLTREGIPCRGNGWHRETIRRILARS